MALFLIGVIPVGSVAAAQADHITATHAWIRLLPGDLPAAGYVTLQNNDASNATMTGVRTDAYASAMIHRSAHDANGMSHMTMVNTLMIPARGGVSLSPDGYHVMLEHAAHPIKVGDKLTLTMIFADGSRLPVSFVVRPANAVDVN